MIRETEMIGLTDGSTKTLEEYVNNSGGSSGSGEWSLIGTVENCVFNTAKILSDDIKAMFSGAYNDVALIVKQHDATYHYPDRTLNVPFEWFKNYEGAFLFDGCGFASAGNPQSTAPFWFTFDKSGTNYTITYAGANHFYSSGTQIDVIFYGR